MRNFLLIAGHGGSDVGATAFGRKEADLARQFVTLLQRELLKFQCNCGVYNMSRSAYHELIAVGYPYDFKAYDYVLEVHFNAYETDPGNGVTKGVEIYVTPQERILTVEEEILSAISSFGIKNRGVKRKNFSVIAKARAQGVSSALLEVCFMDDADDMKIYLANMQEIISSTAEAIAKAYNVPKKEVNMFSDTETHWAKEAIETVAKAQIMSGYADGSFKPDKPVTRAELATVAARLITAKN